MTDENGLIAHMETGALLDELSEQGWSVIDHALSKTLLADLSREARQHVGLRPAAVGRGVEQQHNTQVRGDRIAWIDGATHAQRQWLELMAELQATINRAFYMGLFSFESHYAHYAPGQFYARHRDAFRGRSNRRLSVVTYLNASWQDDWGGALMLYDDADQLLQALLPQPGRMVIFLSEDFPHEVKAASRDRYSIAGWFRVNASDAGRIDPPR